MQLLEVQRILTPSQRRKKALVFKKSMHKRLKTMNRMKGRIPPKDVLMRRAEKIAKKFVIKKKKLLSLELLSLYPSQLTIAQKMALEKKLAKHSALIKKLTPKLYRKVLKQAKEKVAAARAAQGEV